MFPGQGFPGGGMPSVFPGAPAPFGFPGGFPMMDNMAGGGDMSGQQSAAAMQQGQRSTNVNPPGVYFKTRLCNDFREGRCKRGEACKYAHGEHELRVCASDPSQPSTTGQERKHADDQGQDGRVRGENWKTRLCQEFMNTGSCRYGGTCTFAHGPEELRQNAAAPAGEGGGSGGGGGSRSGPIMMPNKVPPPMAMAMPPVHPQMMMQQQSMAAVAAQHHQQQQQQVPQQRSMRGPPPSAAPPGPAPPRSEPAPPSTGPGPAGRPQGSEAQGQSAAQAPVVPQKREEVTYVDRVRAVCAILKIGNAAAAVEGRPAVQSAALAAIRSGAAFRASPFSDDVEAYLPPRTAHAASQQQPQQPQTAQ